MRSISLFRLLLAILAGNAAFPAIAAPGAAFIGLRPAVTVEPEYPAGAFDLNAAPLVVEWAPDSPHLGIRLSLICSLHLGESTPSLAQVGFLASLPWYPFANGSARPAGFFTGPKAGLTWNGRTGAWASGLAVELGWSFPIEDWSVMLAGEYGFSAFLESDGRGRLGGHAGFSPLVGRWLE